MAAAAGTAREPGPGEREAMLLLMGRLDAGGDVNVRCPPVRRAVMRGCNAPLLPSGRGGRAALWARQLPAARAPRFWALGRPARALRRGARGAELPRRRERAPAAEAKHRRGTVRQDAAGRRRLQRLAAPGEAAHRARGAGGRHRRGACAARAPAPPGDAAAPRNTCPHAAAPAQDMNTPLHDAAAAGDAGICAMLLSAGAAVEARASVRGCAARRLATSSGTAVLGATSGAPRAAR